jgi:hypothetical protein
MYLFVTTAICHTEARHNESSLTIRETTIILMAQLSANMKSTICAALNIPMFHKQQHPTNKQWNRNQQNKNNGIGISKTKTME